MSPSSNARQPLDNSALIVQMRPALVEYFRRKTRNSVEAEDLAQDVLLGVLPHAHWKSVDEARGYIFRSAMNRWRDRHRRERARLVTPWRRESIEQHVASHDALDSALMMQEELERVLQELDAMNARTRIVLVSIKLEQMKLTLVAQRLGISVSAVNKHLAKGVASLTRQRKRRDWVR
jgi:RNA polymerase sigma-70 factor (ECF subfamily)